jgi:hypothetical protein
MAAKYLGEIQQFNPEVIGWDLYAEQVALFWEANDIDDEAKRRAVLLTSIGSEAYSVLKNLTAPAKPAEKSLADVLKLLKEHYAPRPNPIVKRQEFYRRDRHAGERIAVYLSELRRLADQCEFETYLDTALRDRLMMGVDDARIQRRLAEENYKELTLTKVVNIALAIESADQSVTTLQNKPPTPVAVNAVPPRSENYKSQRSAVYDDRQCWRCGKANHVPAKCKFKNVDCFNCGRDGHIQRMCRNKNKRDSKQYSSSKQRERVHQVEDEEDEIVDQFEGEVNIHSVTDTSTIHAVSNSVPPFTRYVTIFGEKVTLEVDSGCGVTILNKATFDIIKRRRSVLQLSKPDIDLCSYTKNVIPALGQVSLPVLYRGKRRQLTAYVVDGTGPNLLGRNWMAELGIYLSQVNAVRGRSTPEDIKSILQEFALVFEPSLGTYNGPPVHLDVRESAAPKFCKARPVPFALQDKVEAEIDRLVKEGIYVPVPYSRWATPLVPVLKPNGQVRLCGDYKCTVNQAVNREIYHMPTVEEIFSKLAGSSVFCKIDLSQAFQQLKLDEASQELVTVNTSKGLFRVTRLVYGISSSPAIFQREMDNLTFGHTWCGVFHRRRANISS